MWPRRSDPAPHDPRAVPPANDTDERLSLASQPAIGSETPFGVPVSPTRPAARSSLVAVVGGIVAVLAGTALFVSGFTLGREQAASAGTPSRLEEQFAPFWEAYNKIQAEYVGEVDDKRLVEEAIRGLFAGIGDPD